MRIAIRARNAAIGIEQGRIVPCDGRFDLVVEDREAELRPGLINAHDHLHRNHYGRLGQPPYANAAQWAEHIQRRYRRTIARRRQWPRRAALLAGAWKNLFAGVTTVVHHDRWEAEFDRAFPLRVARVATADHARSIAALAAIPRDLPVSVHVGEGTDPDSARDIARLDSAGLLTARLLAVHAVGLDPDGVDRLTAAGSALVWCPSSNHFLLGRTAPDALLDGRVDVLLGSDSLLSGAGDLLDELRFARATRRVDDRRLLDSVGAVAARRIGLAPPTLEQGQPADVVLFRKAPLAARAEDVALVLVDGVPRVAHPDLAQGLGALFPAGVRHRQGAVERWINPFPHPAPEPTP